MIDLIDRSEVLYKFEEILPEADSLEWYEQAKPEEVKDLVDELYSIVLNMNRIDAEPVKIGTWNVEWRKEDYYEMEAGEHAWQYSKSVVHVTCSCCHADIDAFEWDKSGKGAGGLRGMAYKLQFNRIDSMKKPFCPNCGAKMDGGDADGNEND